MKDFELPEYTKNLPNHAMLKSRDIMSIFNYSSTDSVINAIKHGRIPPPDASLKSKYDRATTKAHMWTLGHLRNIKAKLESDKEIKKKEKLLTKELASKFNVKARSVYHNFFTHKHYKGYVPVGFVKGTRKYVWEYKGVKS
jgi:hypothetical protein